jgi:antirestriction protein ArdC
MSEVLEAQEHRKEADTSREAQPPRLDIRREVTQKIIEAMESGITPWQKPWSAPSMRPVNGVSNNGYRGMNRLLLTLAGQEYGDPRFVTYQQAAANGWNVKRGAKGHMVIKLLEFPQGEGQEQGAGESRSESETTQSATGSSGKRFGLKRL